MLRAGVRLWRTAHAHAKTPDAVVPALHLPPTVSFSAGMRLLVREAAPRLPAGAADAVGSAIQRALGRDASTACQLHTSVAGSCTGILVAAFRSPVALASAHAARQQLGGRAAATTRAVSTGLAATAAVATARQCSSSAVSGRAAAAAQRTVSGLRLELRAVFRPLPKPLNAAGSQQVRRLAAATTRRLSPGGSSTAGSGAGATAKTTLQHARRYNGYSSPYAKVYIPQTTMDPMRVLYGLIGANVAVFVLWQINPRLCYNHFMTSPQHLMAGRVWTLLTAAFSHRELSHLAVNMITLYFFGRELALMFGPKMLLGLYCGAGIIASLAHDAWYYYLAKSQGGPRWAVEARLRQQPPALGASGAVSAIVITDILVAPMRLVIIFPVPIPVPAFVLGIFWVWNDLSGSVRGTDNVGHVAHLGGAATGAAFYWAWRRGLLRRWR